MYSAAPPQLAAASAFAMGKPSLSHRRLQAARKSLEENTPAAAALQSEAKQPAGSITRMADNTAGSTPQPGLSPEQITKAASIKAAWESYYKQLKLTQARAGPHFVGDLDQLRFRRAPLPRKVSRTVSQMRFH